MFHDAIYKWPRGVILPYRRQKTSPKIPKMASENSAIYSNPAQRSSKQIGRIQLNRRDAKNTARQSRNPGGIATKVHKEEVLTQRGRDRRETQRNRRWTRMNADSREQ